MQLNGGLTVCSLTNGSRATGYSEAENPQANPLMILSYTTQRGFPGGSDGEESAYNAGEMGSIPGSGRSSGEGNG